MKGIVLPAQAHIPTENIPYILLELSVETMCLLGKFALILRQI